MWRSVILGAESAALGLVLGYGGLSPLCGEFGRLAQIILVWYGDCRGEGPVQIENHSVSAGSQRKLGSQWLSEKLPYPSDMLTCRPCSAEDE